MSDYLVAKERDIPDRGGSSEMTRVGTSERLRVSRS